MARRLENRHSHLVIFAALMLASCGETKHEKPPPPPPEDIPPTIAFTANDPCSATLPAPTDLFVDADGVDRLATCALPSDPIEAAIQTALADDGVPIDRPIKIPFTGAIDAETLTSTDTIALPGMVSASINLPGTILIERSGTSTQASAYAVVPHVATLEGMTVNIFPMRPLKPASFYVVIATDAIEAKMRPINVHPVVTALVGDAPIAAGTFEGLSAELAAQLEAQRQRVKPVLDLLAHAQSTLR